MDNIVLIGMPGTGKSTVGQALAARLDYGFVDVDDLIVEAAGKTLPEILRQDGLETFYKIENQVGRELEWTHNVIATGGSVVYGEEAMKHLGEISVIVYLRLSYKAVKSRLHDVKGRGVVLRDGQTLHDLYVEREGLYEKYADVTIEEDGLNVEETLEKTLQALEMLVK